MSNQKFKSENYQNLGGINSKASPYITGPMEFLDLANLDFQTPGSLSERWGSTMYVGQTFAAPINSLFEFARLDGSSYVMFSHTGGIWSGATTGNSQGLSLTNTGVTTMSQVQIGGAAISGTNPPGDSALGINYLGNLMFPMVGEGETFYINSQVHSEDNLSYAVLDNYLFLADGTKFLKFDGITTTAVGLPPATRNSATYVAANISGSTLGIGATGMHTFYGALVNNRGFEGARWPLGSIFGGSMNGGTLVSRGGSFLAPQYQVMTPLQFGISAINIYCYWQANPAQADFSIGASLWNVTPSFVYSFPASGSTFTWVPVGSTAGGQAILVNNGGALPPVTTYLPLGVTVLGVQASPASMIALQNFAPKYLETYQNRLFLAGFSTTPSTVWFSDLAEPEGYAADFNFEVRTNDGDYVTAIRAYSTRLYIFKKNSFHALSGDAPENFFLQEISSQYGCLNNRSAVVYDDLLVFLDRKGVIMWNGSGLTVISSKIQPLFDTMNFATALNTACMEHDKLRNQIVIGIPTGNSTFNNLTIVYDYLVGAWTTQKGFSPSAFKAIQGRNNTKNLFYGSQSGMINWFGPSFLSDNGTGFTSYIKTRFLHDMGESSQKMFRRLFLNMDAPSSTLVFGINFFQDYGSSVVLGTTLVSSQFQARIDYGISAKSVAFELSNLQTTIPLKIHGFTIESRLLRRI